ncbi:MAG: hypothetical protein IT559_05945, partial [Alphaproteobacteria bacterium]|nr:hypothetical protein [Alphaproteobacteria bacterium]
PASGAFVLAILAGYGSEAVAAYGVVTRVEAFAFLLVLALAIGMAPIVGQNWGAEQYSRVHRTIRLAINFNLLWSGLAAIVLAVFAKAIGRAFSADPQVIYYAALFLWIVPFSYGVGNLVFGWSSAFNAMGKPQKAFTMIFVKSLLMTVPAVYIGAQLAGVIGVAVALAAANIASGALFHFLSVRGCQREQEAEQQKSAVVASAQIISGDGECAESP